MMKYLKHTSLKLTKSNFDNNMKHLYANKDEDDTKKVEESTDEEDKKEESSKAEDLSNKEEKRFKEEIGEENDDDDDVNVNVEKGDDPDKLDLTDQQKDWLRDTKASKLASQVKSLKAELRSLKSQIRKAKLEPIIDAILDAKSKLGKVDAQPEYNKLIKLDSDMLESLKADYDKLAEGQNSPRFVAKYASVERGAGDAILKRIREGDY